MLKLNHTVERMNMSLRERAIDCGVEISDIEELFSRLDIGGLDELFNDGGEARCEYFGDLAFEYSLQFGDFESEKFENARWEALELAMETFR